MTTADLRRLNVLRRIGDVYDTPDGPRLYENMTKSRSVKAEVEWLLDRHLIDPERRADGDGYRITEGGRAQRAAWEAAA